MSKKLKATPFEEVTAELEKDPEYVKAYAKLLHEENHTLRRQLEIFRIAASQAVVSLDRDMPHNAHRLLLGAFREIERIGKQK